VLFMRKSITVPFRVVNIVDKYHKNPCSSSFWVKFYTKLVIY
jgi:hypothetical protein